MVIYFILEGKKNMKIILKTIAIILIALISFDCVFATINISDNEYVNKNGIHMNQEDLNRLYNLGFTDSEISIMQKDEFKDNLKVDGVVVARTTKYYKTLVMPEKSSSALSMNSNFNLKSITYEISENEYNSADSQVSVYGNSNGYTETNYKKMTSSIIKTGNVYRYKNDLTWKKIPSTRSYDIIGIGIDSTVSGISSSKYFKMIYDIENTSNLSCKRYSSTSGRWELNSSGYAVTFKLPEDTDTLKLYTLSSHMYFDVQKLTSVTIKTLNAYGDYKHAQRKVDSTVGGQISIGTSGINFDVSVSAAVVESYDSITTAQATWSGINW